MRQEPGSYLSEKWALGHTQNIFSHQFTNTVCGFKHVEDVWMLVEQFSDK